MRKNSCTVRRPLSPSYLLLGGLKSMLIIAPNLQLNAGVHRSLHQALRPFKSTSVLLDSSLSLQPTCVKPDPSPTVQSFFSCAPARSGHLRLSWPPQPKDSSPQSGREVGALDHPGNSRACLPQVPPSGGTLPSPPSQLAIRSPCFVWSVGNSPCLLYPGHRTLRRSSS